MSMHTLHSLNRLVWTALLAASVAVGAFLIVPMAPVPISLQPFFIMLAGFILGPRAGAACLLLYVAGGTIGLPIFAGGKSGLAHLMGPTGGYLIGFIGTAAICGFATRRSLTRPAPPLSWTRGALFGLGGLASAYVLGLLWLIVRLEIGLWKALAIGFAPFFPTDIVKLALAVAIYRYLHRFNLLPK
ncbi:biotin transporter BioY [Megalodesulfovibrio gigas]|uniref:Biotin transporter n=1 Tax=Megalodesulfovibrio gigas (strain ATCC 19364 / DSM 1382 / NCIMB 9332 / VKM B-1759) TaxID=1121448 RepID=T2GAT4_MEGG1|nr:biotin transporter BioY [Megalodesulfovibrio gigas]AGW13289.1 putative BioY protein [Megalodesulfovibrio gigas DSM 1382 = ATCC 19364]